MEPFTLVEEAPAKQLFDTFVRLNDAAMADPDIPYQATLIKRFPDMSVTSIPDTNCNILAFAAAGHATVEMDDAEEPSAKWRGWIPDYGGVGGQAGIGENLFFARWKLTWKGEHFIMYTTSGVQYLLKEPDTGKATNVTPSVVDELITAVGKWGQFGVIWVYDGYWREDRKLYESVQKASWDKVILDENTKKDLVSVANTFFDNRDLYEDLGIAWKRGIIFHGPPGNGKTISLKALMHTLHQRTRPIPTLYVKTANYTFNIDQIFNFARNCAPCLLIFEDIETIITPVTRSYFLNAVDGLESNDGILMVATTNFLERLDPGITKRPSRFDRLFMFPPPNTHERTLYAEYWRHKILAKDSKRIKIDFPERLCPAMARITDHFSFAYMQEAFVASMMSIAQDVTDKNVHEGSSTFASRPSYTRSPASQALYAALNPQEKPDDFADLEQYKLWRVFKDQVKMLRDNMGSEPPEVGMAHKPASPTREPRWTIPDLRRLSLGAPVRRQYVSRQLTAVETAPAQQQEQPPAAEDVHAADIFNIGSIGAKINTINPAAYAKVIL